MTKTIIIPEVGSDTNTGNVFNSLFDVIKETEDADEQVVWDFSNVRFLHPFYTASLSIYRLKAPEFINLKLSNNKDLEKYFNLISFEEPIDILKNASAQESILSFTEQSFTPIIKFNDFSQTSLIQSIYENVIRNQNGFNKDMITPFSYMIGELIDNMVDHSLANSGFVFSEYSRKDGSLNICLADDGISILGSFIRRKKDLVLEHKNNAAQILKFATEGVSTKDLPFGQHRGFGFSTSKRMLVEGLEGDFFIFSGNTFHQHTFVGNGSLNLPVGVTWPGTIIYLRIPMQKPKGFNYAKYIQ